MLSAAESNVAWGVAERSKQALLPPSRTSRKF